MAPMFALAGWGLDNQRAIDGITESPPAGFFLAQRSLVFSSSSSSLPAGVGSKPQL
jgi:hypothetical protein